MQQSILKSFGEVDVYLFGSRVDDERIGGDIDLALDVHLTTEEFQKKKVLFISCLVRADFDLKIDIVNLNTADLLLKQEIQKNKIKLFE